MDKTKIQFKALRECVGLSQSELARLMSANTKTIRRWEGTTYPEYRPSEDAWQLLLDMYQTQQQAIKTTTEIIQEQIENAGGKKPKSITLRYWRNQEDYDKFGREKGSYLVINANSRAAANYIIASGLCDTVQFTEGEETPRSVT